MEYAVAARAARVPGLAHADQTTGLAPDCVRKITWSAGQIAVVEPLPHRLAVECGIHPDQEEGQGEERIDTGHEPDRHQIAEFHICDEHTEYEHLEHRPWAQALSPGKDAAQMVGWLPFVQSDQHIEDADQH